MLNEYVQRREVLPILSVSKIMESLSSRSRHFIIVARQVDTLSPLPSGRKEKTIGIYRRSSAKSLFVSFLHSFLMLLCVNTNTGEMREFVFLAVFLWLSLVLSVMQTSIIKEIYIHLRDHVQLLSQIMLTPAFLVC